MPERKTPRPEAPRPPLDVGLRMAAQALARDRLAEAGAMLRDLAAVAPDHPALLQLRAALALAEKDAESALRLARASLERRGDHLGTAWIAARAALACGRTAEAATAFDLVVRLDPADARTAFEIGRLWFGAEDFARAAEAFARAAMLEPAAREPLANLALARERQGDPDAAVAALTQLAALPGDNAEIWFRIGNLHQDRGRRDAAAEAFRTALGLRPDWAEAAVNLGIVLQDSRHLDEAIAAYATAVATKPETFGRVSQALTAASTGRLVLDLDALRRSLAAGASLRR